MTRLTRSMVIMKNSPAVLVVWRSNLHPYSKTEYYSIVGVELWAHCLCEAVKKLMSP